jgi:hypothetical protein
MAMRRHNNKVDSFGVSQLDKVLRRIAGMHWPPCRQRTEFLREKAP